MENNIGIFLKYSKTNLSNYKCNAKAIKSTLIYIFFWIKFLCKRYKKNFDTCLIKKSATNRVNLKAVKTYDKKSYARKHLKHFTRNFIKEIFRNCCL